LGIDVYEQEDELFFQDLSDTIIQDDTFQLLQSFPNVVITAHQAFLTRNALENIATTTLVNITDFERRQPLKNEVVERPPAPAKVTV
jgi:D-lactate dehydrogenase